MADEQAGHHHRFQVEVEVSRRHTLWVYAHDPARAEAEARAVIARQYDDRFCDVRVHDVTDLGVPYTELVVLPATLGAGLRREDGDPYMFMPVFGSGDLNATRGEGWPFTFGYGPGDREDDWITLCGDCAETWLRSKAGATDTHYGIKVWDSADVDSGALREGPITCEQCGAVVVPQIEDDDDW